MPTGKPTNAPITPEQIAMYGHIAAALRAAMTARDMTVADVNEAMGVSRGSPQMYLYLRGKQAPSDAVRRKLAKLLGIPEQDLMKRELQSTPKALTHVSSSVTVMKPMSPIPVLSFAVSADGTVRIKLDAAMTMAQGAPLLRILLDAGIVPMGDNDDGA